MVSVIEVEEGIDIGRGKVKIVWIWVWRIYSILKIRLYFLVSWVGEIEV